MNETKKTTKMDQTEKRIREILSQDVQIPDLVQERILDTYEQLPAKKSRRPRQMRAAAAILALLCLALPAAAYASAKTGFFQAMFGNSTKGSHDVIHKMVDNGKGGQTAVTIPSKEYVPVDETEAERLIGEWVMDEPIVRTIGSHTLTLQNFAYDRNGALLYFTLEREGGVTALAGDEDTNQAKGATFTEEADFYFTYETQNGVYGYADIYIDTVKSTPDKMYASAYILWVDPLKDGDIPCLALTTYPCPRKDLGEDTDYSDFPIKKIPLTDKGPIPTEVIDLGEQGYLEYSPISMTIDMARNFGLSAEEAQDPYNVRYLAIQYTDGSLYVIFDSAENIANDGYVLGSGTYYKTMFNRLVDTASIKEILVNDVSFQPTD